MLDTLLVRTLSARFALPQLLFKYVWQGESGNAKAIYFQRSCGFRAVSSKDIELDIAYGEILNSPLEDFDRILGQVFLPLLKQQDDWGKCNGDADARALLDSAQTLRKTLDEAIVNVNAGECSV